MIPAWHRVSEGEWLTCWLISSMPHGNGQRHVLVAFDDTPHESWGYPLGSLVIRSVSIDAVRIRRTVIPVNGA